MNREQILNQAASTMVARKADYGRAELNFDCVAAAWEAYLTKSNGHSVHVEAKDVANLMVVFKAIRSANPTGTTRENNIDDFVDMAAYSAFAGEFAVRDEYSSLEQAFGVEKS